jgi:hypothetical protein
LLCLGIDWLSFLCCYSDTLVNFDCASRYALCWGVPLFLFFYISIYIYISLACSKKKWCFISSNGSSLRRSNSHWIWLSDIYNHIQCNKIFGHKNNKMKLMEETLFNNNFYKLIMNEIQLNHVPDIATCHTWIYRTSGIVNMIAPFDTQ